MRITVGHILIVAGVGAYFAYQSPKDWGSVLDPKRLSDLTSHAGFIMDFFKSGSQPTPLLTPKSSQESVPVIPVQDTESLSAENGPIPESSGSNTETSNALDFTSNSIPVPAAEMKPVEKPTAPIKKKSSRVRKGKKTGAAKLSTKTASSAADPLLGTYVALTLDSGREVKGILQERTAALYKIELPGMGPFTYQASKVVSVKPAQ